MTKTHSDVAIVRHVKTNRLYRYLGNDEYMNLYTGQTGRIRPEQAKLIFVINLEMTQLIDQYPMIEEMITKLKLVFDK